MAKRAERCPLCGELDEDGINWLMPCGCRLCSTCYLDREASALHPHPYGTLPLEYAALEPSAGRIVRLHA